MFRPRITADQLGAIYGSAAAALEAADFYTAIRLSDGDPTIEGIALTMLGHERRGLAMLEGAGDEAVPARLVQALGLWLTGACDEQARGMALGLAADAPDCAPAQALLHAMDTRRPHIVYACTAANTLRAADILKACDDARVTVLRNTPLNADVAFGPATPASAVVQAIGDDVDCVLIDNLIMLPPQLAAIRAPKIAQVFDIEFFYAQRGRELAWIDMLICPGNSMDHASARIRFGDHAVQRAMALDELMQARIDPRLASGVGIGTDRPIDLLVTGGVDKPFFPDKQQRFSALAQAHADLDIRVIGRYLPPDRYNALTRAAKYVLASNRASNAITARTIEALCAGTMVACQADEALSLLFGDDLTGVHQYRDGQVARDIADLVGAFDRNHAAFVEGAPRLAEALHSLLPPAEQACLRAVRYMTFWSQMARRGLGWRSIVTGGESPDTRRIARPAGSDCYAAKQESWLGLPRDLRGKLLAPLAAADGDALVMPRLGQTVTAQAFHGVNALDEDLYRHQSAGVRAAGAAILRTLNRARRKRPNSLATWFLIGRHLAECDRFDAAIRVLESLVARFDVLELEDRLLVADSTYEVADWPLVDAMMRDDLARHAPAVCGPDRDFARHWLAGRTHALLATLYARCGDSAASGRHASCAMQHAGRDVGVLGAVMSSAVIAWQYERDRANLARATVAYFRGLRLSLRFMLDEFPRALEMLHLLGRRGLACLLVRYWFRTKARIFLDGEAPVVTPDERFVYECHATLFQSAAEAFAATRLQPAIRALRDALEPTETQAVAA